VKQEVKTADGVIRGAYSYVDADGIVQTVNYIADALGFRVGATNLPVHHVDAEPVAAAAPVAVAEEPVAEAASAPVQVAHSNHHVMTPAVNYAYLPYATNYAYETPAAQVVAASPVVAQASPVVAQASPVVAQASPVVAAAPVESVAGTPYDATNTQYHAQDDIGQFNYGYSNPLSTKQELKTADGVTRGSYSYVDANGIVQTVNYLSDALGFKVAATNLPVGPAPEHPVDHVEPAVVEAYSSPAVEEKVMEPTVQYAYLPYAQNYEYYGAAKPVAQATPVTYTQTAPVVAQAAPVTYAQAAPVVAQAAPVVAQAAPVVAKAAPVVAQVAPIAQAAPVVAQVAPVVQAAPVVAAASPEGSQYHAQDDIGQYSFGYSDGNSVKQEVKTADGVIRGAYSYVDADGIVQTVNYIADALGFRVGATNLPVHHVDAEPVAAAAPVAVAEEPVAEAASAPVQVAHSNHHVMTPAVNYAYLPYATNYAYETPAAQVVAASPVVAQASPVVAQASPVVAQASPVVAAAPVESVAGTPYDATNTQYHAQDDIGQFNYGYSNPLSTKQELKTADGVTRGSYSYVDANGIVQTVNYLSDALGFKVAATNLPVGPAPEHPVDHVEPAVVEAYSSPAVEEKVMEPTVQYAYLPYAQNYEYYGAAKTVAQATPVTYTQASPIVAEAAPVVAQVSPVVQSAAPVVAQSVPVAQQQVVQAYHPYASSYTYAEPIAAQAVPVVAKAAPVAVAAAPVEAAPAVAISSTVDDAANSQYHAQDDIGQFNYGYSNPLSTKQELKTADGVTRGSYSYVDANGIVQTVNYLSDAAGFRVAATNLPVHNVEGAPAAPAMTPVVSDYAYLPYASTYGYNVAAPAA